MCDHDPGRYPRISRRDWLARIPAVSAATLLAGRVGSSASAGQRHEVAGARPESSRPLRASFRYCLNTSTIRGHNLSLPEQVDLAAKAGYHGIEPWIRDIAAFRESGGALRDLRRRISDHGLQVESGIGFARWIVEDPQERARGLEQMRRDMDLLRQIGGRRIAAPPVGAHRENPVSLDHAAERYHALLELGREMGVTPQLEIWGTSRTLSRLCEAVYVAVACGDADACLLPDVYHLFRGGSPFEGLRLIAGTAVHVFHLNDYPADPPRNELTDAHRVFPGDGVAPWPLIRNSFEQSGFRGVVSLELFNRDYWKRDPLEVARTGLEKMRAVLEPAAG